jgi:hypothetical protein
MATKKSTEVTTKKNTDLADTSALFDQHAGDGLENVTKDDLMIPRLTIIQGLSPQIKKNKAEYIEDAEEGDICDVGLSVLFKEPILFLPVRFVKNWLEWAPRSSGKGLVAIHDNPSILDRCDKDDKGSHITSDGNYIGETAQFFGLNLSTPSRQPCFVPMASTQLKKSRRWLSMISGEKVMRPDRSEFTPPMWYRTYILGVGDESNAEGDWKGWTISRGPALPDLELESGVPWEAVHKEATDFFEMLKAGDAKADMSGMGGEGTEPSNNEEGAM